MLERLSKTRRNVGLIVVAAVLLWAAWAVRNVLNPLILGYLLAYILRPYVLRLEERGMGRRTAVNIIFSLFAIVLTVSGVAVVVQAQSALERLVSPSPGGEDPVAQAEERIDAFLEDAKVWFEDLFGDEEADAEAELDGGAAGDDAEDPDGSGGRETPEVGSVPIGVEPRTGDAPDDEITVRGLLRTWAADLTSQVEESGGAAAVLGGLLDVLKRVFGGVMSVFGFLVLLPVYTYFLLFELERIHEFLRSHVPKKERERVTRIGRQIGDVVANFFRGRMLICFLKGSAIALGLAIADVPHAFLLGMTSGFLALIPFVGPTLGFVVTYLVGLQRMEVLEAALWIAPVFMLAEVLEGYVLIPKILGDSLGLHPVVILVAIFIGGSALGLFGFLIAVPLAATAIILFRELVMPAVEDFAEEDSHVDEDPTVPA